MARWPEEVADAKGGHVSRVKTPHILVVGGPWGGSKFRMFGGKMTVIDLFGSGGAYILTTNNAGKDIYKWVPNGVIDEQG